MAAYTLSRGLVIMSTAREKLVPDLTFMPWHPVPRDGIMGSRAPLGSFCPEDQRSQGVRP